ncbi:MAG: Gx transporter family protein [Oscillospiraceae bacterium]|nr:Gx transporter family protein [Oscillospiraceae bacterium]
MTIKKMTLLATLTAAALVIFMVEAQIDLPFIVPGMKLGLANTITLFALFYGPGSAARSATSTSTGAAANTTTGANTNIKNNTDNITTANALLMLIARILLGALFIGRITAFIYSITGGLIGFAAQAAMKKIVTDKQIWVCGAAGAVMHNVGQILAAMLITGTSAIAAYLPILIIAGIITGVLTGMVAQLAVARLAPHKYST